MAPMMHSNHHLLLHHRLGPGDPESLHDAYALVVCRSRALISMNYKLGVLKIRPCPWSMNTGSHTVHIGRILSAALGYRNVEVCQFGRILRLAAVRSLELNAYFIVAGLTTCTV